MLGLDESIRPAVNKMRRNLLKLLNVGEFDPCATWQDPCISFTLPEVSSSWRNQERQSDDKSSWKATKVIPQGPLLLQLLDVGRVGNVEVGGGGGGETVNVLRRRVSRAVWFGM